MIRLEPKNILLNPVDYLNSSTAKFLTDLGLILHYEFSDAIKYSYIIDDFCSEISDVPRLKLKKNCFAITDSYIDFTYILHPEVHKLIRFKLGETKSNDLLDEFFNDQSEVFEFKFLDQLNIGFITDKIVNKSIGKIHNPKEIRDYFNILFSTFSDIAVNVLNHSLFDVSVGFSQGTFVSKVTFDLDINNPNFLFPKQVILDLARKSNFISVDSVDSSNKIIITACWYANPDITNSKCYFTDKLTSLESYHVNLAQKFNGLLQDDIKYAEEKKRDPIDNLTLAKKLSIFIKKELIAKNIDSSHFVSTNINQLLSNYPDQEIISSINPDVESLIVKFITNTDLTKNLDDYVKKVSNSSLNSQINDIKRIFGEKGLKDIESAILVRGNNIAVDQVIQRVKSWFGEHSNSSDTEIWNIKKKAILSKIDKEIGKLDFFGSPIVIADLINIVSTEIGAPSDEIQLFLEDIIEESLTTSVFGKDSLNLCLDVIKEKQAELDKILLENKKLSELAIKTMRAYKEITQKNQVLDANRVNQLQQEKKDDLQIKQVKLKNDYDEARIVHLQSKIEKLEKDLRIKDAELLIFKMRNPAAKDPKIDQKYAGLSDDKFITLKSINQEENPVFLLSELKKYESKMTILNTKIDDLRKLKIDADVELAEKKKELQKVRNENNLLNSKVFELERKSFEKKAV